MKNSFHLKNILSCLVLFLSINSLASTGDSLRINELLKKRSEKISLQQNTNEIDSELFNLGYLPPAIVKKTSTDENINMLFSYYKGIREENKDRIIARLKATYPEIITMDIITNSRTVEVNFTNDISEEKLISFFKVFGYEGYMME